MFVSRLVSRPVSIRGRKTTIKLEPEYWRLFDEICAWENTKSNTLIFRIKNAMVGKGLLASAIRVYVVLYFERLYDLARQGRDDLPCSTQLSEGQAAQTMLH
jgi:predicted DNA-binding ribbon-helix-helix protein